jgi:hypothetical protein
MERKVIVRLTEKATKADYWVLILAGFGLSYKAIADRTGLTVHQVRHRLSEAGVKVRDYRNGQNKMAERVIDVAEQSADEYFKNLQDQIRAKLLSAPPSGEPKA